MDATIGIFGTAGDAENAFAAVANLSPHGAPLSRAMHDLVQHAAQRNHYTMLKWCSFRQSTETRGDPSTMTLREVARVGDGAAWRHREDRFAIARMNTQRITARAAMPTQPNGEDLRTEFDRDGGRFGGTTIKEGAKSHVSRSGRQEVAGILPYPPPRKSLSAKTNHLPNIQGPRAASALYRGARNPNFCVKSNRLAPSKSGATLITS